jgi:hypothetical protein
VAAGGELSLSKLRSLWQNIRTRAEERKTSLRAALSRATLASLEGDVLTLRVPDPINAGVLKRDVETVRTAIADVTGHTLDVRIAVGAAAAPPEEDGPAAEDGEDGDDLMRYALEKLT